MALGITLSGSVILNNLTLLRNEVNRIRNAHAMTAYTFVTSNEFVRSADMTDLKTAIGQFTSAYETHFPATQDTSTITPVDVGTLITAATFTATETLLTTIAAVCHNYSNQSVDSDRSNNANYSDDNNNSNNSFDGVQGNNANYSDYSDDTNNTNNASNC